jgi:pseudaminic acid biosynthesis-associated methylase
MNTEQEKFWAGEFGNDYSRRNQGTIWVASNTFLFSKILTQAEKIQSIIEFGSNIGLNLLALKQLYPEAELSAIEINNEAVKELKKIPGIKNIYTQSILDFTPDSEWDLVLIKGVLIHINPEQLPFVYDLLFKTSRRYICIAEYYNPSPVEIPYRGHKNKLFKRDFAGEILDRFSSLRLVNYGFAYHRDPFPQDDLNWFLFEKK